MGHPLRRVELPGLVDPELAATLHGVDLGPTADVAELQSLLTGGPGRPGQLTATAWIFDPTDTMVLLARHRQLGWSNPGGHVEPGETPLDAAAREAFEETGLIVRAVSTTPVSAHARLAPATASGPPHIHWNLGYRFVARASDRLGAEHLQPVQWWPVSALPPDAVDDLLPGIERLLRAARR